MKNKIQLDFVKSDNVFNASIDIVKKIRHREHLANPFLNILNTTTKSKKQYPDLFEGKGLLWRFINSCVTSLGVFARSIIYYPGAIKYRYSKASVDVIIISHLNSTDSLSEPHDFYFGDVEEKLFNAGYKSHTLLINHCKASQSDEKNLIRERTSILPAYLSPLGEIKAITRMVYSAIKFFNYDGDKSFLNKARLAQFNSRALGDYRIGNLLQKYIKDLNPKFVLHTFEGHGWERIMLSDCKNMKESPLTIGYQHAVVFPGIRSLNYLYGLGGNPDEILTTGSYTLSLLKRETEFKNISILGSIKSTSVVVKDKLKFDGACLIAPEGTIDEVLIMAKFVLNVARISEKQKFILRLHPVLSEHKVKNILGRFGPFPRNFLFSDSKFDTDMEASSWVCYRGSSMAVQGIMNGLRPIFIDADNSFETNDPLPSYLDFRKVVKNARELSNLLLNDKNYPDNGNAEFEVATQFAKEYIMPVDTTSLFNILKR